MQLVGGQCLEHGQHGGSLSLCGGQVHVAVVASKKLFILYKIIYFYIVRLLEHNKCVKTYLILNARTRKLFSAISIAAFD